MPSAEIYPSQVSKPGRAAYALNRSIGQSPLRQFAGGLSILVLAAAGLAALLATFGMR